MNDPNGDRGSPATMQVAVEPPEEAKIEEAEHFEGDSTKLLRITVMAHELLDEVRQTRLDEGGRRRLRAVHDMTVNELKRLLPEHLRQELEVMTLPLGETASESEVRLAQVQLVGWLEGLMHGIQAALWAQVAHALSHARRLPPNPAERGEERPPGQYL